MTTHSGHSEPTSTESSAKENSPEAPPRASTNELAQSSASDSELSQLTQQLSGANGHYQLVWEPNRVQGSVHAVAVSGSIVAIGAGYLYDNEIHVYQWDASLSGPGGLRHVYDIGDGILHSDVLSLTFGDTDRDSEQEIAAVTADGGVYVYEQLSNDARDARYYQFQLVWNTNIGRRATSVAIDDLDGDGLRELIVGAWSRRVYVYEYAARVGQPTAPEHHHYYALVWDSGSAIQGLVNTVVTGDTTADGFKEIIAGASDGKVYIFENRHGSTAEPFFPHADNSYSEVWNSTNMIQGSVQSIAVNNFLDQDPFGEIAVISAGQGAFMFDYVNSTGSYVMNKLMRGLESYENDPKLQFPIDPYVDLKVSGDNVTDGVFEPWQLLRIPCPFVINPYCNPPYQANATAMAGSPDFARKRSIITLTLLNSTSTSAGVAKIVLDTGKDEELTGQGNDDPDLTVYGAEAFPQNATLDNVYIDISQNGHDFVRLREGAVVTKHVIPDTQSRSRFFNITIDVDPTMRRLDWDWFRYIRLETSAQLYFDAIVGNALYRPITDAVSTTVGLIPAFRTSTNTLVMGTATGSIKAFAANGTSYRQIWDSYGQIPLYKPGTNQTRTRFPPPSMNTNIWSMTRAFGSTPGIGSRFFLVLGTNPKVAFVEVDPNTLEAHVAWDTGNVIDRWTVSVTVANIDGKNETIVGSFDNNIYIFDHVYRNTYRRAWRSPDLTHNQTIWDHVSQVVVGDYNSDGKLELLAANDNQTYPIVYVFERNSALGPDRFSLNETLSLPKNSGGIVGMDIGNDLNHNHLKEVVVASEKNVTLFENVSSNTINATTFQVIPAYAIGRLLALVVGDADGDGLGDIIVGGSYPRTEANLTPMGVVIDYEYNPVSHKFLPVWSPPFTEFFNKAFTDMSIVIGDQDRNGKQEIIIGHSFGINVYENTGDNSYTTKQIMTSSATYPYYRESSIVVLDRNYAPGPNDLYEGWSRSSAPVVQLSNKTFVAIFTAIDSAIGPLSGLYNQSRIFYRTSQDGEVWSSLRRLTSDSQYPTESSYDPKCGSQFFSGNIYYERNPSAVVVGNAVYVAYEAKLFTPDLPSARPYPSVCLYVTRLGTRHPSLDLSRVAANAISPSILLNSTLGTAPSPTLSLAYLNYTNPDAGAKMLHLNQSQWALANISVQEASYVYPRWTSTPGLQNSQIGTTFRAFSQKTALLEDGTLATVFDGVNATSKQPIPHIWFTTRSINGIWSNAAWLSVLTFGKDPTAAIFPIRNEIEPSITVLKGNVLAVVYEEEIQGNPVSIYITVSTNNGTSWTDPQLIEHISCCPASNYLYAATVNGLVDGGYLLSFHKAQTFGVGLLILPTVYMASNPLDGWWRYTIGPVRALVLADTDLNGLNEIIAGSLNHVYVLGLLTPGKLAYQEKWVSQDLAGSVTDIAIGDINEDGVSEIVVTTTGGNVYAFEWITP